MTKDKETYWLGFDLGGTKMLATVFDGDFKPLGRERTKTKGYEGVEAGLNRMVKTIHKALADAEVDVEQLAGAGVGCPGPLDLERGIIRNAPNLSWKNAPVKEHLENALGCPTCILNDVDAGVYGEFRYGAAQDAHTVVGVFPGTGIGGGCVYQGNILRGKTASCMEIGHVQVAPEGPICACGRRGCLEAVASRLVIAAQAAASAQRGQAPNLLKQAGTDLKNIRSGAIAASVKAGDTMVETIVREAARHIGRAVAGIVNLLGPDMVVLGGGLVEAMSELFVEEVQTTSRNRVLPSLSDSFDVVAAQLGDDASVMGAAGWAEHSILQSDLRIE